MAAAQPQLDIEVVFHYPAGVKNVPVSTQTGVGFRGVEVAVVMLGEGMAQLTASVSGGNVR